MKVGAQLIILVILALPASARQRSSYPSVPNQPATLLPPPSPSSEKALEEALKKQRASLETQRQAIARQLADKGQKMEVFPAPYEHYLNPQPLLNEFDCPALASDRVTELITSAARKQSLDPALLRAVIKRESGFKPCAVSTRGAQGLMQLMPATARELHVSDVFDPAQNVQGGAAYLKQMLNRYKGDLRLALIGYNAGPGRADQTPDLPYPIETQNYVADILSDLDTSPPAAEVAPDDATLVENEEQMARATSNTAKATSEPGMPSSLVNHAPPKP